MSERMGSTVLRLDRVGVRIPVGEGRYVHAVDEVSLSLPAGQVLGLVGESGCGKSTLAGAVLGLLPPDSEITGRVLLREKDLRGLSEVEYRALRGNDIALITQDPGASLDPTFPVGQQVAEAIRNHQTIGRRAARQRAVELLRTVGIPAAEQRYSDPPHRFSGGMKQRALIAAALANDPSVLLADEPTTALDVTIQAQILYLIRDLAARIDAAVLLITHNLGVVAQICDRVSVMYAGQVVEQGTTGEVFAQPRHPYTRALLAAQPVGHDRHRDLPVIPGRVPDLKAPPTGCRFAPRCASAHERCTEAPPTVPLPDGGEVACWLHAGSMHTDPEAVRP